MPDEWQAGQATPAILQVCVCVCVCVCVRERQKIEPTVCGKKVPISLDRIQTSLSGMRAHRACDYTTRVRPPRVSRNKHFTHVHSPVSSTAKQSCMKHSNSYLLCVCVCVCAGCTAAVGFTLSTILEKPIFSSLCKKSHFNNPSNPFMDNRNIFFYHRCQLASLFF